MAIDPNSTPAATANSGRLVAAAAAPSSTRAVSPQLALPIPARVLPQWAPYPVASSGGRGFRPVSSDQSVTVANFSYPPPPPSQPYVSRPLYAHHHHPYSRPNLVSAKGLPPPSLVSNPQPTKVASSSVPESNGYKDMSEKGRDETLTVVRDRKVRLTEGRSLYAHCRSWLKNGFPEESQPQYGDTLRSLPKPSSIPLATGKKEGEGEVKDDQEESVDEAEKEDEESVEHLCVEDLFKRHVNRAKKVRARLREVRLKRIARYKSRLALLLPPLVEQFRNDASAGGT